MNLDEFLIIIPKAELYVHLIGAVFPKTLEDLSKKNSIRLPKYQKIEDLYDRSQFRSILPMLKVAVEIIHD